ncbi:MAG: GntR family transcriptional regulator [Lewinellaceae bacterium]|nr:GntR family transcriptional regulator [Lewinellaceae bacterium]
MEFRDKQAIYLQIADYVCEQILLKKWNLGDKILSIRELAVLLEVNPNTVARTYDFLQQRGIIVNKRGIGLFVDAEAGQLIRAFRREQFMENELPVFFRNIYLLDLDFEAIKKKYDQFVQENFKNIKL